MRRLFQLSHGLTLVSPHRLKQIVVPFRDSKLTRVFQGFFTGRGRSCMIVNINQCASTYDETLYVAKFSAIASQVSKTNELCDMLRIPPASVRTSPFPSQGGENAFLPSAFIVDSYLHSYYSFYYVEKFNKLQRSTMFKDYMLSRLCVLVIIFFSLSACSGSSYKGGTAIHTVNHQRAQQENQPGSRGSGKGRSGIRG